MATVSASDAESETITYAITAGNTGNAFTINSSTGAITTAAALDYETTTSYSLTVTATDAWGNATTTTQTVNVTDVNENNPTYTYKQNIGVHYQNSGTNQKTTGNTGPEIHMKSFVEDGLGHTATTMNSFTSSTLAPLDLMWVTESYSTANPFKDAMASGGALNDWIYAGGTLIFHDRSYSDNEVLGNTSSGVNNSGPQDQDDVTFADLNGLLANGPAGTLANSTSLGGRDGTLDGGSSTTHGRTLISSLPNDAIVTIYDDDQNTNYATDFWYGYGSGHVYYSHIPLDCYIGGGCDPDNSITVPTIWGEGGDVYSENLLHYMLQNTVFTGAGTHRYNGTANSDTDDTVIGNHDANVIWGGLGADDLLGLDGADTFLYTATTESDATNTDTIEDYTVGSDKIDISAITSGASISRTLTNSTLFKIDHNNDGTYDMQFTLEDYTGTADEVTVVT